MEGPKLGCGQGDNDTPSREWAYVRASRGNVHCRCDSSLADLLSKGQRLTALLVLGRPRESDDRITHGMEFFELPWRGYGSSDRPAIPGKTTLIKDLRVDVNDFQVDPSQDLLVLVERLLVR